MTLEEFFDVLKSLPVNWRLVGNAIRSIDHGTPSESYSPLEVVCHFKGGTVSWRGGRTYKPRLLDDFFVQGEIIGLSEADTHAIFRATDNEAVPDGKQGWSEKDCYIRKRLLEICNPVNQRKCCGGKGTCGNKGGSEKTGSDQPSTAVSTAGCG